MASYMSNFLIAISIVLYTIMNLNNVYCPTRKEIEECQNNLTLYCGDYLKSALNCAKVAILIYLPRPLNEIPAPNCVTQYFANHISPFISTSGVTSVDDFCANQNLLVLREYLKEHVTEDFVRQYAINQCERNTWFLRDHSLEDFFFKKDSEEHFENKFAIMYLKEYARDIKMFDTVSGVPKSPEEFCQTFENN